MLCYQEGPYTELGLPIRDIRLGWGCASRWWAFKHLLKVVTKVRQMPAVIKWHSIKLFHNVVVTYKHLNSQDGVPFPTLSYRGKIKLHGTNCAVQVRTDGIYAQSRSKLLTLPSGDRKGFAHWVEAHRAYWKTIAPGITVFGEWCGPGVEKKAAIAKHDRKVYAVFSVQLGFGDDAQIVYEPSKISGLLTDFADGVYLPEGMYILPWFEPAACTIDYGNEAQMAKEISRLNAVVLGIEKEDPWVKETFGISGVGEGVVMYPVDEHATADPTRLAQTMFKAKGEKHAVRVQRQPVQISPQVIASTEQFVAVMVTDARLEQGLSEVCEGVAHMRYTGAFLNWVSADVQKESVDELAAADLTWKQVHKAVQAKARSWLRARV